MKIRQVLVLGMMLLMGIIIGVTVAEVVPEVYDWDNRKQDIPDKHVFQTSYLGGSQIVFDHAFHTEDLELECIECHHVEGCVHCHKEETRQVDVASAKTAIHRNCFACHEDMSCVDCHDQ